MAKKIMFSDKYGLTAAVLSGTKTQTRRIATSFIQMLSENKKYLEEHKDDRIGIMEYDTFEKICVVRFNRTNEVHGQCKPRYKVGEIVAVAQAYKDINANESYASLAGWSNKMFVKAEDMPHQIRITRVWIELLQDISDEDCLKEGIFYDEDEWFTFHNAEKGIHFGNARAAYAALIDKIAGKGTWESNPYVYCYEFELVK